MDSIEEYLEKKYGKIKYVKILDSLTNQHFSNLKTIFGTLAEMDSYYAPAYSNVSVLGSISVSIWRSGLQKWIKECLEKGLIELEDDKIKINIPVYSFELPEETLGTILNYKSIENDTLSLSEYNAISFFMMLVEKAELKCIATRSVIIDDEHRSYIYLFKAPSGGFLVFKNMLHYDPDSLRYYDNIEDAIIDFKTIDFGWKNWSPLQAQELKVKPLKRRDFDWLIPAVFFRLGMLNGEVLEQILDGKWDLVKVEVKDRPSINVLLYNPSKTIFYFVLYQHAVYRKDLHKEEEVISLVKKVVEKIANEYKEKENEIEKEAERLYNLALNNSKNNYTKTPQVPFIAYKHESYLGFEHNGVKYNRIYKDKQGRVCVFDKSLRYPASSEIIITDAKLITNQKNGKVYWYVKDYTTEHDYKVKLLIRLDEEFEKYYSSNSAILMQ
jgi:hypothetical protein